MSLPNNKEIEAIEKIMRYMREYSRHYLAYVNEHGLPLPEERALEEQEDMHKSSLIVNSYLKRIQ